MPAANREQSVSLVCARSSTCTCRQVPWVMHCLLLKTPGCGGTRIMYTLQQGQPARLPTRTHTASTTTAHTRHHPITVAALANTTANKSWIARMHLASRCTHPIPTDTLTPLLDPPTPQSTTHLSLASTSKMPSLSCASATSRTISGLPPLAARINKFRSL